MTFVGDSGGVVRSLRPARNLLLSLAIAITVAPGVSSRAGGGEVRVSGASVDACDANRNAVLQEEMRLAYDRILQSPAYTGIALNDPCGPIDLYSNGLDLGFGATAVGTLPAGDFRLHVVPNSFDTLNAVQERITTDMPTLKASGLHVYRYWPDMASGKEIVQLADASAAQLDLIAKRYGSAWVQPQAVVDPPLFTTHRNDGNDVPPPFDGADFIAQLDAQQLAIDLCTSAFGVHTGSQPVTTHYILTAGHCNEDGSGKPVTAGPVWHNALITDANGTTSGSLAPIGTVTSNFLGQHVDGAYISVGAGTTNKWIGWYTSGSLYTQYAAARALVGNNVCVDGAYDGQLCGGIVQSTGYLGCMTFNGDPNTFCSTVQDQTGGAVISGEGDSGAPVYLIGPTQISLGIETGGLNNLPCPHFTWRGNVCGAQDIFTDLPTVLGKMSAAVNTTTNP